MWKPTIAVCILSLQPLAALASVSVQKNPQSGLLTWRAESHGFYIELIQLLPDFVRAIYASHGFPKAEIEEIAGYCVFGTIIKNTTDQPLSYRVSEWYYQGKDGVSRPVKTKTQWLDQWRKAGIVFSWTLLPDAQTFAKGDWQQGFTTIAYDRDQPFTLYYNWRLGDREYRARLENMQCAPEELHHE